LRLAEVAYAPLDRSMLPLSGRGKGPSRFRLLGQYKGALILLEGPDGLYLLDQHVAHERILYERLRAAIGAAAPPVQHLLSPILLELAPAERMRLAALAERLAPVGFEIGELSGGTLALTAMPAVLSVDEAEKLVMTIAATPHSERATAPQDVARGILEALAASQACKAAIKMHHPLSAPAMESLVSELFATEEPFACPHGRPVVLQMTDADLERRFGRR
jgi:DNA mismatch repair protein MutL